MVQENNGKSITVVTGVPGSGKTTWGINLVADLINNGVDPTRILVASFSRAAAEEFLDRAIKGTGITDPNLFPFIGTIHGICFRLLHLNTKQVWNDDWEKTFGIEYHWVFSQKRDQKWNEASVSYDFAPKTPADSCLIIHRHMLRSGDSLRGSLKKLKPPHDGYVYKNFMRFETDLAHFKNKFQVFEFDDFILETIKRDLTPPVDYMICDEFQDNSRLHQAVIASWYNARACPLYLLGDADQTIYGFMGANPKWITEISGRDNVKTIKLQETHRFGQNIASKANAIISMNRVRIPQEIKTISNEPIIAEGKYRTKLEDALTEAMIRATSGESVFFLNVNNHYIEKIAQQCISLGVPFTFTKDKNETPLAMSSAGLYFLFKRRAINTDEPISMTVDEIRSLHALATPATDFFVTRGLKAKLERDLIKMNPSKLFDEQGLYELGFRVSAVNRIKKGDITLLRGLSNDIYQYLDKIYDKFGSSAFIIASKIKLGTIHSVKGKEADHIYLLPDIMKKSFDSMARDIEEGRRLYYVAITRAKKTFTLLRRTWGERSFHFKE